MIRPNIYTLKITYATLENKFWRMAKVQDSMTLAELAYCVLASFDAHSGKRIDLYYERRDAAYALDAEDDSAAQTTLKQLKMTLGDVLVLRYGQAEFHISFVKQIKDRAEEIELYPQIAAGEGRGPLENLSASEAASLVEQLGANEKTDEPVLVDGRPWDYRTYKLSDDALSIHLKMWQFEESYTRK